MKQAQNNLPFNCPLCNISLKPAKNRRLYCPGCQTKYPLKGSVPFLLPPEENCPPNHFSFAGKDIPRLTQKIKTPFYLFSERIIEENFRKIKESFSQNGKIPLKIYYSAKTNYEPEVLKTLKNLGSGLEAAWGAEIYLAKKVGFQKENVCFDGPVKTDEDLKMAIKWGININADSFEEAKKISQIAKSLRKKALIGSRINPESERILPPPIKYYFTKFGVKKEQIANFYLKANRLPNIKIINISAHIGSQLTSPKPYLALIETLTSLAKQLEKRGLRFEEFNIGGGFPSPTLKMGLVKKLLKLASFDFHLKVPPLSEFGWKISEKFVKETKNLKSKPILAIEPGRSIVSNAGILVTKVMMIKNNNWIFLDGSKYAVPESLFFSRGEITIANRYNQKVSKRYNVAGSSLNTGDIFGLSVKLPEVKKGDTVVILDAGAYSISRAVQFTVLNPPIYYLRKNGKIEKIRRKGQYGDSLSPSIFKRDA